MTQQATGYVCCVCGAAITGEAYYTLPHYPVLCSADYQRIREETRPRREAAAAWQAARRKRIEERRAELLDWATSPRDERDYTAFLDTPDTPAGDIGNMNNRELP